MNNYKYSQTWFIGSDINLLLSNFLNKSQDNKILEIGCFEGLSSTFFADNFIDNTFFIFPGKVNSQEDEKLLKKLFLNCVLNI